MKLKAVVDSLDSVPEQFRECYVAFDDDGTERFKLDLDGVAAHPDTAALQSAHNRNKTRIRELTGENNTLKAQVADFPENFDADLYERAVEQGVGGGKIKNEDEIRAEAAAAATKRAEDKAKKDLDKVTVDRDRYKSRVENTVKRETVDAALDAAGVTDPTYKKAARALLMGAITLHEDGDDLEALAKDEILGDIPVAEYVKSWAGTDEGKAFVGARNSAGGGANGGGQGGNAPTSDQNPFKAGTFNVTEQVRLRRENPTLAERLQREARAG